MMGSDDNLSFPPISGLDSFQPHFEFKAGVGSDSAGGETLSGLPKPLVSLHETPIPPFLSKTYDLVDDTLLDPVISWGENGVSFVVWDPAEFARMILPRNFKHNNFSSFVRQLNTYGFRKIDPDRWEFANEGFVRGQKHLLKKIQRRRSHHQSQQLKSSSSGVSSSEAALEGEIEDLRKERSLMLHEVLELQNQQRGTARHMEAVNEKLEAAEERQKQMVSFLAQMLQKPEILASLQHKREKKSIEYVKHEPLELDGGENHPVLEIAQDDEMDAILQLHTPEEVALGTVDEVALGTVDAGLNGKGVMSPQQLLTNNQPISYPEDVWSMGFEGGDGSFSNCDVLSDVWDVDAGDTVAEKWLDDDFQKI